VTTVRRARMVDVDGVEDAAPEKRIGDRERREVDARLQQAHGDGVLTLTEYDERSARCWAARTRSELDGLVRDLPDPTPGTPPVPASPAQPAQPATARRRHRHPVRAVLTAILVVAGVHVVTADDGIAVFGGRVVQVAPGQDRVEVGVLFGGVQVVVPDDARVDTEGLVIFGGTDCGQACSGAGTRAVTVDARGGFGGVDVLTQTEYTNRAADRDRDDDD
jgi:Domain of unknown function (DUF1707)